MLLPDWLPAFKITQTPGPQGQMECVRASVHVCVCVCDICSGLVYQKGYHINNI